MKYTVSDALTLADVKSEDYKYLVQWLKGMKQKDFEDDLTHTGRLLKVDKVEIVRNKGSLTIWVDFITMNFDEVLLVSADYNNPSDNFTVTYKRQR